MKRMALLIALSALVSSFATATTPIHVKTPTAADAIAESDTYDMYCNDGIPKTVEKIDHFFRYSYEGPKDAMHGLSYFIVSCSAGAYNASSMMFRVESSYSRGKTVEVLKPVSFAVPRTNNKDQIVGWSADVVTAALAYDKKTNQLTSFSKGRGLGDLYVLGTYALIEDEVVLRKYEVDNKEGDDDAATVVFEATQPLAR